MVETEPARGVADVVVSRVIDCPFRVWVFETQLRAALAVAPKDDPVWREPGAGATYENDCERGKRTTRDPAAVLAMTGIPLAAVSNGERAEWWSATTGIRGLEADPTLHGGGLHVTAAGGWLTPHLDYARHPHLPGRERRLSTILFLSPEWREEWGGAFLACHPDGSVAHRIYPAPGRVVAFETGDLSYHGTDPTAADAPDRVSLAAYFLTPARDSATRVRALFLPNRRPA